MSASASRLSCSQSDPKRNSVEPAMSGQWAHRYLDNPVVRNALALYAIQIAGYVLPLVTIPYLARTLHPEGYGLLLFFQSFALWSSMIIEYGFNLSATREVARSAGKPEVLAEISASVLGAKLVLFLAFLMVAGVMALVQPNVRAHPAYLLWAIPMTLALGFSPFWYFQGTERMVGAVVVEFLSRALATVLIFFWVRTSDDAWKALALYALAGGTSTLVQTGWMYRNVGFRLPCCDGCLSALKQGWNMFLFRGAYNIYSTSNAFILGMFAPPVQVGFYGSAERISRAFQGLSLPISQSLYPRLAHLVGQDPVKTARLARLALILAASMGFACALLLATVARWGVGIILGPGYEPASSVLYVFAIVMPVNFLNDALIMQWMLPLNMERAASVITLGAVLVNLTAASLLAPRYAHTGMAFSLLLAEVLKLVAVSWTLMASHSRRLAILCDGNRTL